MKTIWLVGGGFESVPGIDRARGMGLRVAVSDGDPDAPGLAAADFPIVVSTYDVEATVDAMRCHLAAGGRIDGVCSVAADVPVTVAVAARELGLPGIPVQAAQRSMDKLAMKDVLASHGVPIPEYSAIRDVKDLRDWVNRFEDIVIKPVDSRGARGVLRLSRKSDLVWAFEESLRYSPSGRILAERFMLGPQVSTEGLLIEGRSFPIAVNDRNYEALEAFHPFLIENGGSHPSFLSNSDQRALSEYALEAGRALGVSSGVVKGDMVLTAEGPKVIEVALRLSGGFFCTHQIPLATGVDLVGTVIRMSLGAPIDEDALRPRFSRGVAIRYLFPTPGNVVEVRGVEDLRGSPGIEMVRVDVEVGEAVGNPRNHTQRGGCVLSSGADAAEAIALAEQAVASICIETREKDRRPSGNPPSPLMSNPD